MHAQSYSSTAQALMCNKAAALLFLPRGTKLLIQLRHTLPTILFNQISLLYHDALRGNALSGITLVDRTGSLVDFA